MDNKTEIGDIRAPVEDTDVPLGLKVLVIIMIVILLGLVAAIVAWASQAIPLQTGIR